MKKLKHSDNWYKYQYYIGAKRGADGFGFVHFESEKEMELYKLNLARKKAGQKPIKFRRPTEIECFVAGCTYATMICVIVWILL